MVKDDFIKLIDKQIQQIDSLKINWRSNRSFSKWSRDTEVLIGKVFGEESKQLKDFNNIHYIPFVVSTGDSDNVFYQAHCDGLDEAYAILNSIKDELIVFGSNHLASTKLDYSDVKKLENLFNKFHLLAHTLRNRHANRQTLDVHDEYDVQDLLHSLLQLYFSDIRIEETCPSYAGSSSRQDFLLKNENIVIEVKKTRKGLDAKKLGEELTLDKAKYRTHPDCKTLLCFVYDPEGRIANPRGIENDLSEESPEFTVKVFIKP